MNSQRRPRYIAKLLELTRDANMQGFLDRRLREMLSVAPETTGQ